jgi:hypothetical protein
VSIRERVRAGMLEKSDPVEKTVATPWGPVVVREMLGEDFDLFLETLRKFSTPADYSANGDVRAPEPKRFRSAALVYVMTRDPDTGERVFDPVDVPTLAARPVGRWLELFDAADSLSQRVPVADTAGAEELGESSAGANAGAGSAASSGSP